ADGEGVGEGVGDLAVDFVEADILLHDVAVRQHDGVDVEGANPAAAGDRIDAGSARIQVTPDTDIKRQRPEGRADTAVDIDLGGSAVGERDARERRTDVKLQVLADVVARLEIGGHRRLVVRLGDATEHIVVHDAGAE